MASEPWELVENPSRYDDYNWYSDKVPARKFYLFLAEIGRRLRRLMTDPGPMKMIDLCEQCAEGELTEDELSELADGHRPDYPRPSYPATLADDLYFWVADRYKVYTRSFYYAAKVFAAQAAAEDGLLSPQARYHEEVEAVLKQPRFAATCDATAREWGAIVREIYGPNPFHLPAFNPAWLAWNDRTIHKMAQIIYDESRFDRLPLLADALEDAGCDNANLLTHCRGPGPHVRGCWAIDLVLDKT